MSFPLQSWGIVSPDIEFMVDSSFLSALKILCYFLLASVVSNGKSVSFELVFPYRQWIVFLIFQGFVFVFNYQKFNHHVSCHGFLWAYLFEVCPASWSCRFMSFTRFGKFSAIIFLNTLSALLFLFSFWDSDDMNIGSFVTVSQVLEALFICFQSLFSLLFTLGKSYWSVFKFIDFYPLSSLLLSLSSKFLFLLLCLSVL